MSEAPNTGPGSPIWVDLTSPDVAASTKFYGGLFGWEAEDLGEQAGHYHMFRKDGKMVAAASPPMDPTQHPAWTTYVATPDAAATAAKVREAGGKVVMEPMVVMDAGSMAVFQDPTGAYFAVWQPGQHKGAELFNKPGSLTWNELSTRDISAAKGFYGKVFGWGAKDSQMGPDMTYTEFQIGGSSIAGGMPMAANVPPNVPSHWLVYFAVADVDATIAKAQESGAQVMVGRQDSPAGPFGILVDPQGAMFAVIQVSAQ
jgi:predicted enzyme related to lactoylglutathione lyase